MICGNCGTENRQDASFCRRCGIQFQATSPQQLWAPSQKPQNYYPMYQYQVNQPQKLSDDATMRAPLPVGRTGLSIAAGWIGFFSLIIWPLGIVAVIFSIDALNELNKRPDMLGKGRALFGLMTGLVGIGLLLLVVSLSLASNF